MKNAALSVVIVVGLVCAFVVSRPALAQDAVPHTLIDDPGTDCLNYQLDVVTLKANNTQIYWKADDCIRIYISNNPFLFKWNISVDEKPIAEDDVSSVVTGLGVNQSSSPSAPATPTTGTPTHLAADDVREANDAAVANARETAIKLYSQDQTLADYATASKDKKTKDTISAVRGAIRPMIVAGSQGNAKAMGDAAKTADQVLKNEQLDRGETPPSDPKLQAVTDTIKTTQPKVPTSDQLTQWKMAVGKLSAAGAPAGVSTLSAEAESIIKTLDLVKKEYDRFADTVPDRLAELTNLATPIAPASVATPGPDTVQGKAKQLSNDAKTELRCLTAGILNTAEDGIYSCPGNNTAKDGKTLESRLVAFANLAAVLHEQIQPYLDPTDTLQADVIAVSNDLHAAAEKVAFGACRDQGIREQDLSSLKNGLITPLDDIRASAFSYGYPYPQAARQREGPWVDPESVTLTLTRDSVSPFSAMTGDSTSAKPANTASSFTCSSDTTDLFENGGSYNDLSDFFREWPVPGKSNAYTKPQNKPQTTTANQTPAPTISTKNATKPGAATADNTVLVQPWLFGRPRLVLSGGISTALLTKQEFQRTMSISGAGDSETVVGYKTNSKIRTSPMLYGHALIPFLTVRHNPEAWYATVGVSSSSDNKGTDPEFLFGLSRSLVQQRFFITAGAYVGERQKLAGGLYPGEVIPSTFTGDIPVTKGYRASFGFGLSYRFTSTKKAQDTSKSPSTGSKTKN
jgi:hypothetical protein